MNFLAFKLERYQLWYEKLEKVSRKLLIISLWFPPNLKIIFFVSVIVEQNEKKREDIKKQITIFRVETPK